jgi:ATP-binding cassette subfamily B (MDR/TAP) protein 6
MEEWETTRYKEAIMDYQNEQWKSSTSLTFLNFFQGCVVNAGLLALSLYCSLLVSEVSLTIGDFVLMIAYYSQLMGPLNFLGTQYRIIQESFVNMENMFDLLAEPVEVQDPPLAVTIPREGTAPEIEFQEVSFSYVPGQPVLQEVSFTVAAGTATAVVGTSGSGKSSLAKLFVRMFDCTGGSVRIGGRDVREVTQEELRRVVGVVPQDTVLFNNTIQYNIRYGRVEASDAEVEAAAQLAEIHNTIQAVPKGYQTRVGERGL